MSLVLDGGNSTFGGPVDLSWDTAKVVRSRVDKLTRRLRGHETELDVLLVLISAQVRELVVTKLIRLSLGVVGGNIVLVVSEVLEHLHEVHTVYGLNLVSLQPVEELLLIKGAVMHIGRDSGGLPVVNN